MQLALVSALSAPVLAVSVAAVLAMCVLLMLCVCGKQKSTLASDDSGVETNRVSTFLDAETLRQMQSEDRDSTAVDVDTGVTPLNSSRGENGAVHSRGNSADLTKVADRHSGASTGSSPRPATIGRELPDIPGRSGEVGKTSSLPDRGHHSVLPDIPSEAGQKKGTNSALPPNSRTSHGALPSIPPGSKANGDASKKVSHLHGQLPDIPKAIGNTSSPVTTRIHSTVIKVENAQSQGTDQDEMDDYDHIEETSKKKSRPRSDYDHVIIEGGEKKLVLAKSKWNENDYAEVGNMEIPTTEEIMVIPISKPVITSKQKPSDKSPAKPVHKTDSFDYPYNRIKDDSPYNKIKEGDMPDTKVRDDPFNKMLVDDPYNTVKEEMDDLDPYNTVNDGPSSARSSSRQKQRFFNYKGPVYDPYAAVVDEERNVSNQTDPYARVGDTESEIDDPYNKVVDETESVVVPTVQAPSGYTDDDYATVNKNENVEYAKVNKSGSKKQKDSTSMGNAESNGASLLPSLDPGPDEYATVQKVRKPSTDSPAADKTQTAGSSSGARHLLNRNVVSSPSVQTVTARASLDMLPSRASDDSNMTQSWTEGVSGSRVVSGSGTNRHDIIVDAGRDQGQQVMQAPPEPPRDYDENDNDDAVELDGDHYNTVAAVGQDRDNTQTGGKKEPPYNKLSVRESLASMNARAASNTYEYVSEVDNLYATVDGSSGDGVVRRGPEARLSQQQPQGTADLYAEINAPAPPSLDSLHETARHHLDEIRRKQDKKWDYYNLQDGTSNPAQTPGHQRTPSGHTSFSMDQSRSSQDGGQFIQGHSRTPSDHETVSQGHSRTPSSPGQGQFRPSSADVMSSSFEGRVPIATAENVDLDLMNFNSTQDNKIPDNVSEFDPNYETVDEAKAKLKYSEMNGARPKENPVRPHIYEVPDSERQYIAKDGETVTENGKIRAHVYEEVKEPSEARRVKQRVLSRHTYEEVTEVKDKNGKQQQNSSNSKVTSKKKEHQKNLSGDWSLFGKKKTSNDKDKSKDAKPASEDKTQSSKGKK